MGLFNVPIGVGDPQGERFQIVEALVDTGATFSIVPAPILDGLGVEAQRSGSFELADGSFRDYRIGETILRVESKEVHSVVVFGDAEMHPILGAVTLEILGLGVDPAGQRLIRVPYRLL
jgi:predicted aspartyl protease